MSRLYEALSRIGKQADETTGVDWREFGTHAAAAASASAPAANTATVSAAATALPNGIPPIAIPEPDTAPPPAPGARQFGRAIAVAVDARQRLLPYAIDPAVVESYRRLRTKILQRQQDLEFRTLMVTSGNPQEGKTLTALNLALSLAMVPSFRVLVIDGDLRKGSIAEWLGVNPDLPGLSNLIDGSAKLQDVVLGSNDVPMQFMLRGNSQIPPAELLNSPSLREYFADAGEHFDLVLVDSPPVQLVTDAHLLAAACDAVILIARGFSTTKKMFEKTVQEVGPAKVIGTVLNAGTIHHPRHYEYYRQGAK